MTVSRISLKPRFHAPRRINLSWRILGSLVAQAVIMAAMPLVAPYSIWGPLTLMFLNGLCTMVLQSSLFGLAR